ncbi:MAG: LytTR family transcriptional regulator [Saprospiraceae bacterium]|nr:LytTR family transcriptional regulator [Saprospiraceae bacterium]
MTPATVPASRPFLMIKVKQMLIKVWLDDIIYCEGANVNVRIVTSSGEYLTRERLKHIEQQLPVDRFLRIHDSFIVNLEDVKGFASNFTTVELHRAPSGSKALSLPVGPKYRQVLKEKLQN